MTTITADTGLLNKILPSEEQIVAEIECFYDELTPYESKSNDEWRFNNFYSLLLPKLPPRRIVRTSALGMSVVTALSTLSLLPDSGASSVAQAFSSVGDLPPETDKKFLEKTVKILSPKTPAVSPELDSRNKDDSARETRVDDCKKGFHRGVGSGVVWGTQSETSTAVRELDEEEVEYQPDERLADLVDKKERHIERKRRQTVRDNKKEILTSARAGKNGVTVIETYDIEEVRAEATVAVEDRHTKHERLTVANHIADRFFSRLRHRSGDTTQALLNEVVQLVTTGHPSRFVSDRISRRILAGHDGLFDITSLLFWLALALLRKQKVALVLGVLDAVLGDAVDWAPVLRDVALKVPVKGGYEAALSEARNALMHAQNGNGTVYRQYCSELIELNPGGLQIVHISQSLPLTTESANVIPWVARLYVRGKEFNISNRVRGRLACGLGVTGVVPDWSTMNIVPDYGTSWQIGLPQLRNLSLSPPMFAVPEESYSEWSRLQGSSIPNETSTLYSNLILDGSDATIVSYAFVLLEYLVPDVVPPTQTSNALNYSLSVDATQRRKMYYSAAIPMKANETVTFDFDMVVLPQKSWGSEFTGSLLFEAAFSTALRGWGDKTERNTQSEGVALIHVQPANSPPVLAPIQQNAFFIEGKTLILGGLVNSQATLQATYTPKQGEVCYLCFITDSDDPFVPMMFDMRGIRGLTNQAMHALNGNIKRNGATNVRTLGPNGFRRARPIRSEQEQQAWAQMYLAATLDGTVTAGFNRYLQRQRNRMQHSLNGNSTGELPQEWKIMLAPRSPKIPVEEYVSKILGRQQNTNIDAAVDWTATQTNMFYNPLELNLQTAQRLTSAWTHFTPAFVASHGSGNAGRVLATTAAFRGRLGVAAVQVRHTPSTSEDAVTAEASADIASWVDKLKASARQDNTDVAGFNLNFLVGCFAGGQTISRTDETIMLKLVLLQRFIEECTPTGVNFDTDLAPWGMYDAGECNFRYQRTPLVPANVGAYMLDAALTPGWGNNPNLPTSIKQLPVPSCYVCLEPERFTVTGNLPSFIIPNAWCQRFGPGLALAYACMCVLHWPLINWPSVTNTADANGLIGLVQHNSWLTYIPGLNSVNFVFSQVTTAPLPAAAQWGDSFAWSRPRYGALGIGGVAADAAVPIVDPQTTANGGDPNFDPRVLVSSYLQQMRSRDIVWIREFFSKYGKWGGQQWDAMYELSVYLTGVKGWQYMDDDPRTARPMNVANQVSMHPGAGDGVLTSGLDGHQTYTTPLAANTFRPRVWVVGSSERTWNMIAAGYCAAATSKVGLDVDAKLLTTSSVYFSGMTWAISFNMARTYSAFWSRIGLDAGTVRGLIQAQQSNRMSKVVDWVRRCYASTNSSGSQTVSCVYSYYSPFGMAKCVNGDYILQRAVLQIAPRLEFAWDLDNGVPINTNCIAGYPDWLWSLDDIGDYCTFTRPPKVAIQDRGKYGWQGVGRKSYFVTGGDHIIGEPTKALMTLGPQSFTPEELSLAHNITWVLRARHLRMLDQNLVPFWLGLRTTSGVVLDGGQMTRGYFCAHDSAGHEAETTYGRIFTWPSFDALGLPIMPYSTDLRISNWHEGSTYGGYGVVFVPKYLIQSCVPIDSYVNDYSDMPEEGSLDPKNGGDGEKDKLPPTRSPPDGQAQ